PPSRWAETHVPIGSARSYGDGRDLTIVTFGNGVRMSLRAAVRLTQEGYSCRVLDLRWLAPLPVEDLLRAAELTGKVLIADETRHSGGVSEGVMAELLHAGFQGQVARVTSADSFIPLGAAADHVLLSEEVAELMDAGFHGQGARVTTTESFIPLGAAPDHMLQAEEEIEQAARKLLT